MVSNKENKHLLQESKIGNNKPLQRIFLILKLKFSSKVTTFALSKPSNERLQT